ncbi:DNA-directed RNA polymerase subunit 6 homolog [Elysia marginata]|uniref:DNA-directed RNA polymerase subunit 6 homolog n=1 Tax=Elysia marginata TaxID=1093978 RepID=A0AAV4GWB7_9GAST|nr:DNA-directed RNA polymerase subunit 6 homolog [Elysia marginata]
MGEDGSVVGEDMSDVELDDEFDDFDPLADSGGEEGDDDDVDDAADEKGASDDGNADASDNTPRLARKAHRKEAFPAYQTAQAVGARRIIVVAPEERQSSNMMTLAEATRAIAIRAKQISTHPYAYTDVGDLTDAISIARKELFDRRSPLQLERRMGRTSAGESIIEIWEVRKMSYPPLD